jgi:hypothetical protein
MLTGAQTWPSGVRWHVAVMVGGPYLLIRALSPMTPRVVLAQVPTRPWDAMMDSWPWLSARSSTLRASA